MLGISILVLGSLLSACSSPGGGEPEHAVYRSQSGRVAVSALSLGGGDLNATVGTDGLRTALAAVDRKDAATALSLARHLPDIDKLIVEWMLIRRDVPGISSSFITEFARTAPDWPSPQLMRKRAEAAILHESDNPQSVIAAFGSMPPETADGAMALGRAYIALGRSSDAGRSVGRFWRSQLLDTATDAAILKEFGRVMPSADVIARWRMLMYGEHMRQAEQLARALGGDYPALTAARAAEVENAGAAEPRIAAVPASMRGDPLFRLIEVGYYRKTGQPEQAAALLMQETGAPAREDESDAWWVERRITSRQLIEHNNAALAYRVVAMQRGGSDRSQADAAFHCGWYALRFLHDTTKAIAHFQELEKLATKSGTRARSAYWLGRAYEAAGDRSAAITAYQRAAHEPTTFYGQLSLLALGHNSIELPPIPTPSDADRAALSRETLGRVLTRLNAAGYSGDSAVLYTEVAKHVTTTGGFTVLAQMAEAADSSRAVMQIGIIGSEHGFPTERLAYPTGAIPASAHVDPSVERALVFALSRQESNFDPEIVSAAGAVGLMQLMPATARHVAHDLGLPYSEGRLTDPSYNATLGSAYLRSLLGQFNGSYILTIASYNAGKNHVDDWVQRFGDPRDPRVDPIDWIESIPFSETRSYVQKVLENLQIYRARLSGPRILLLDDMHRGRG